MINLTNVAKRHGARVLFENVSLRFDPGKRYGIVGANGSGKSTLLRMMVGQESWDEGEIHVPGNIRVGTMNQDHFAFERERIKDVVLHGKEVLSRAVKEKAELLAQANPNATRIGELEMIIADQDGYVADARITELLEGLGVPASKHEQPMTVLSGGYKLRVLLAQCLFSDPDVLLLDEPPNHLDILSIKWLESYLHDFRGTVILVSHDRTFLNAVCTHIADIDFQAVKIYSGNYDAFLQARKEDEVFRQMEAEKAEKRIDELKQFVTRFKAKATKARQAQSKAKQIERMEKDLQDPVYSSRVYPAIRFEPCRPPGKTVLEVNGLGKSFGDLEVLRDLSFRVMRGHKLAVIGPNGVGKSTLLKIIMGVLEHDEGGYEWGYETHPTYFAQDHSSQIKPDTTPYEWLYGFAPGESIGTIRGILGSLLFSGDDVHKPTSALSGGESARLIIAKAVLTKGNVLVLDEPTNHLDMESIESLVEALRTFEGTMILVSHNRYVVDQVADQVLELKRGEADFFDGPYHEYLQKVGVDHLDYRVQIEATKKPAKPKPSRNERKMNAERRKAYRKEVAPVEAEIAEMESRISGLESELEEINDLFSDPVYFSRTSPDEVRRENERKKGLERDLSGLMKEWEAASLKKDQIDASHGMT